MKAIFAVDANDGFGTGLDMPWPRCSEDLKRFKAITTGHTIVMGSGTWYSNMPKPLPNRRNCVMSSSMPADDRCEIFRNIDDLLMHTKIDEDVFVIGGAKVLFSLRMWTKIVYLTRFKQAYDCEIKMDTSRYLETFQLKSTEDHPDHTFEIYERIQL